MSRYEVAVSRVRHFGLALLAVSLVGCSTGRTEETVELNPLPTTGSPTTVVVAPATTTIPFAGFPQQTNTSRPFSLSERAYIEWIEERAEVPANEWEVIAWGTTWCDFMERGMNRTNLTAWISEMANSDQEAWAWLVSAEASATHLCVEQEYKWNP